MSKTVFVGLSGGVDSSVTAALLKEQGYSVVGVYMKNWSQDLPGFPCPWKEDYQDAKRIAVQLGIEFKMFDFETEYRERVVDAMIEQFKLGVTPNPDIMCNQEIKFKLFLETSLANGADMIATGHYARTRMGQLLTAEDTNKDQTYFLYRVTEAALQKTLFPIGSLTKPEVRQEAEKRGLITAKKKESMGICFVGKVGIKEFLKQYVTTMPGPIVDQNGREIGEHDGAIFYTIGQRHGLEIGGGMPYYVTGKDMGTNTVRVTNDISDKSLWSKSLTLTSVHWINEPPHSSETIRVRTRHRAPMIGVESLRMLDNGDCNITVADEIRAVTPGQSAVLYADGRCLGGGIVV